jgi:hypothetical protein
MRLRLVRREGPYPVPPSAIIAAAALVVLGLAAAWSCGEGGPILCPFRHLTGLPCPACGLLRAARSLMRGGVAGAFAVNPLDALVLLAAPLALVVMALSNRAGGLAVRVESSRKERFAVRAALVTLLLANWAYVLVVQN